MIRQAIIQTQEKNIQVGVASRDYDVSSLTSAMCNLYINKAPSDANMNTQTSSDRTACINRRNDRPINQGNNGNHPQNGPTRPTFYTFESQSSNQSRTSAILDSGAYAYVVGKTTVDSSIRIMGLSDIPDGITAHNNHRFGNHQEDHRTLCAIKFPLQFTDENDNQVTKSDIMFNVIEGNLPFLIGLPTLMAMRSAINLS